MNDSITSGDVTVCNPSVINCDVSITVHFNINEVSLDCSEPTVVHRS